MPSHISDEAIWKSLTVMAGIYMFYMVERVIKIIINHKAVCKNIKITVRMSIDLDDS